MGAGQGKLSHRHVLADCWVVKSSELGLNDDDGTHCRTFLGAILSIGDTVLGLDLRNSNVNNPDMEKMSADKIPDVVLVKKVFGDKALRNRRRKWNLKHMEGFPHMETESANGSMSTFTGRNSRCQWTRMTTTLVRLRYLWLRCLTTLILERTPLATQGILWQSDIFFFHHHLMVPS